MFRWWWCHCTWTSRRERRRYRRYVYVYIGFRHKCFHCTLCPGIDGRRQQKWMKWREKSVSNKRPNEWNTEYGTRNDFSYSFLCCCCCRWCSNDLVSSFFFPPSFPPSLANRHIFFIFRRRLLRWIEENYKHEFVACTAEFCARLGETQTDTWKWFKSN